MARYVGLSACEANAKAIDIRVDMEKRNLYKNMIKRFQAEKTWELPEDSYERKHLENELCWGHDLMIYGFGIDKDDERLWTTSREEWLEMLINFKVED